MLKPNGMAVALFGLSLLPGLVQAQGRQGPVAEISPYIGYMKLGSIVEGPLSTALSPAGGAMYGAQVRVPLTSNIALVGGVAHSAPELQVGAPIIGGLSVGQSSVWLADANLELSAPLSTRGLGFTPFVQAGGGLMRHNVEVSGVSLHSTGFAYNFGLGADLPLASALKLRLMAKDYVSRFDAEEATTIDVPTRTTHNWGVSAGLSLGL